MTKLSARGSRSKSGSQDYISSSLYAGSPKYTIQKATNNVVKKFFDPGQFDLNGVSYIHGTLENMLAVKHKNSISGQNSVQPNGNKFKKFQPSEQVWLKNKQNIRNQNSITGIQNNGYKSQNTGNGNAAIAPQNNRPRLQHNQSKKNLNSVTEPKKNGLYKAGDVVSNSLSGHNKQQMIDQRMRTGGSYGGTPVFSGKARNDQSQRKGAGPNRITPQTNRKTNSIQGRKRKFPLTKLEAHLKTELQKMMNRYDRIKENKRRRRKNRLRNRENKNRQNKKLENQDLVDLYWMMDSFDD